jgi:carbohydrate-selective porin OprB
MRVNYGGHIYRKSGGDRSRGHWWAAHIRAQQSSRSQLNQAHSAMGLPPLGSEKAVEVNYVLKVTGWFTFQPALQYYFDSGASSQGRNATVAGFRTTFSL